MKYRVVLALIGLLLGCQSKPMPQPHWIEDDFGPCGYLVWADSYHIVASLRPGVNRQAVVRELRLFVSGSAPDLKTTKGPDELNPHEPSAQEFWALVLSGLVEEPFPLRPSDPPDVRREKIERLQKEIVRKLGPL